MDGSDKAFPATFSCLGGHNYVRGERKGAKQRLKPTLIRSDSVGRKRPFSTGLFSGWVLLGLFLVVSLVNFIVFTLVREADGVNEYCCAAVENRLETLGFMRSPQATGASRVTNPLPSGWVALDSAESRPSYVRGVALRREPPKPQQA